MQLLKILLLTITVYLLTILAGFAQDHVPKTDSLSSVFKSGWTWETFPKIKDTSLEEGKIIYKITLNSSGEVEGIQLLESTVKKKTEEVYREGLSKAKFKRTGSPADSSARVTGTITFNLKVR